MNQAITKTDNANLLKKIVIQGDLSKLSEAELYEYNLALCELHGLNPLTQPFNYLNSKMAALWLVTGGQFSNSGVAGIGHLSQTVQVYLTA